LMRRWALLEILTYRKYVPVSALRPPSLKPARDAPQRFFFSTRTS
jgi:hypothetical protein